MDQTAPRVEIHLFPWRYMGIRCQGMIDESSASSDSAAGEAHSADASSFFAPYNDKARGQGNGCRLQHDFEEVMDFADVLRH
jgi:hypothetical protein